MNNSPNVILVSIDALRADHLSCYGYERETTPFLDSLAEESTTFTRTYSASSHTREAVPALLTGCRPPVHAKEGFRLGGKSVAESLSDVGYATGGFHSNPYASRAYGFDAGFDTFDDDLLLGGNRLTALAQRALEKFVFKRGDYYARAEEINDRGLSWLSEQDEPFFLWLHYMDVHGPYAPPEEARRYSEPIEASEAESLYNQCVNDPDSITDEQHRELQNTYDDEIRYCDSQIEALFEALESTGALEETIVVVTADHGDAFGEHGYYAHPRRVDEELLTVPLLVSHPSSGSASRIGRPVSLLDIVPSILQTAGLDASRLPGHTLFDATGISIERSSPVFSSATGEDEEEGHRRFAAHSTDWTARAHFDAEGSVVESTLIDAAGTVHDSEGAPEDGQRLLNRLCEHAQSVGTERAESPADDEPAEVERRLEALGYK